MTQNWTVTYSVRSIVAAAVLHRAMHHALRLPLLFLPLLFLEPCHPIQNLSAALALAVDPFPAPVPATDPIHVRAHVRDVAARPACRDRMGHTVAVRRMATDRQVRICVANRTTAHQVAEVMAVVEGLVDVGDMAGTALAQASTARVAVVARLGQG